jgi:hypothetical protein
MLNILEILQVLCSMCKKATLTPRVNQLTNLMASNVAGMTVKISSLSLSLIYAS